MSQPVPASYLSYQSALSSSRTVVSRIDTRRDGLNALVEPLLTPLSCHLHILVLTFAVLIRDRRSSQVTQNNEFLGFVQESQWGQGTHEAEQQGKLKSSSYCLSTGCVSSSQSCRGSARHSQSLST